VCVPNSQHVPDPGQSINSAYCHNPGTCVVANVANAYVADAIVVVGGWKGVWGGWRGDTVGGWGWVGGWGCGCGWMRVWVDEGVGGGCVWACVGGDVWVWGCVGGVWVGATCWQTKALQMNSLSATSPCVRPCTCSWVHVCVKGRDGCAWGWECRCVCVCGCGCVCVGAHVCVCVVVVLMLAIELAIVHVCVCVCVCVLYT
jgi:hypothetical protein